MLFNILYITEYVIQWVCRNYPSMHALHKLDNWTIVTNFPTKY